jgi:hypothetical protein
MKPPHIIGHLYCKAQTYLADSVVREYFGVAQRRFRILYSPSGERCLTQKLETALGIYESNTSAYTDRQGITFPKFPTKHEAEHELVHAYHISINESAVRIEDKLAQLEDQLMSLKGQSAIRILDGLVQLIEPLLLPRVAYEAVAHGFNWRNKKELGVVRQYSNYVSPDDLRNIEANILHNAERPGCSIAELEYLHKSLEETDNRDIERTMSTLRIMMLCLQEIGKWSGSLMLAEPNVEPEILVRVDKEKRKSSFGIFYPLVPVADRQKTLREMFEMDVMTLSMKCIDLHRERLDPFLQKGYRLLAERFKQEFGL